MTLKNSLLFILILMASTTNAQTKKPASKPKTKPKTATITRIPSASSEKSLLWEITGKGLTSPSYLFGTMHILCDSDATLSPSLKTVIKECSQVFFEVDMDDMQSMMGAIQYARMNDGVKISDLITPVEFDRVKKYFNDHKTPIPFMMMNRFKPYFVSAIISEGMLDCPTSSMEQRIISESKKYKKEILGLETLEFQASLFDSIPYEKQAKDLVMYVDSVETFKQTSLEMEKLYRKQDVTNLDTLLQKSDPGMLQYMDMLLYDRNLRWSLQVPEHIFFRPTLFAVGAGHLGGDRGLISLLKKQGFTLRPLKN